MARPRSLFAGGTDYTGVSLDDMLEHLRGWREGLDYALEDLQRIRARLSGRDAGTPITDGLEHCDYFTDLFGRYRADFVRLVDELPRGVLKAHVDLVDQLYTSSTREEELCILLKRRHHLDALPSDPDRPQHILAALYSLTRDELIGMRDLSNLSIRLRTFVVESPPSAPMALAGYQPQAGAMNALELKPNIFGIGLNLNFVIERWGRRLRLWKRREK